jgi:hypothetical protein
MPRSVSTKTFEYRDQQEANAFHLANDMNEIRATVAPANVRCGLLAMSDLISIPNHFVNSV